MHDALIIQKIDVPLSHPTDIVSPFAFQHGQDRYVSYWRSERNVIFGFMVKLAVRSVIHGAAARPSMAGGERRPSR